MSGAALWATFAAMGAITLALRASFLLLGDRLALPPLARRALVYVPPAVLAALVTPALFEPSGVAALGPVDVRLLAGAAAVAVAWRTKSVLATLGTGMGALWTLGWLLG